MKSARMIGLVIGLLMLNTMGAFALGAAPNDADGLPATGAPATVSDIGYPHPPAAAYTDFTFSNESISAAVQIKEMITRTSLVNEDRSRVMICEGWVVRYFRTSESMVFVENMATGQNTTMTEDEFNKYTVFYHAGSVSGMSEPAHTVERDHASGNNLPAYG